MRSFLGIRVFLCIVWLGPGGSNLFVEIEWTQNPWLETMKPHWMQSIFYILSLCLSDRSKKKCFSASSCTIISLTPSRESLQKHIGFVHVFLEVFYYTFGGMSHVDLKSGSFNPTFTMNVILPEVILLTKIIVNISMISSLYCISCPYWNLIWL